MIETAKSLAEEGIRIYCIGVGSPAGKPIPVGGELMKDKKGNIVVSKLDESILRQIAGVGGGEYVRAGNSEFGLNPIIDNIRTLDKEEFQSMLRTSSPYWYSRTSLKAIPLPLNAEWYSPAKIWWERAFVRISILRTFLSNSLLSITEPLRH